MLLMNKTSTQKSTSFNSKSQADKAVEPVPSKQVIENILNYSRAYEVKTSEKINFIETILN